MGHTGETPYDRKRETCGIAAARAACRSATGRANKDKEQYPGAKKKTKGAQSDKNQKFQPRLVISEVTDRDVGGQGKERAIAWKKMSDAESRGPRRGLGPDVGLRGVKYWHHVLRRGKQAMEKRACAFQLLGMIRVGETTPHAGAGRVQQFVKKEDVLHQKWQRSQSHTPKKEGGNRLVTHSDTPEYVRRHLLPHRTRGTGGEGGYGEGNRRVQFVRKKDLIAHSDSNSRRTRKRPERRYEQPNTRQHACPKKFIRNSSKGTHRKRRGRPDSQTQTTPKTEGGRIGRALGVPSSNFVEKSSGGGEDWVKGKVQKGGQDPCGHGKSPNDNRSPAVDGQGVVREKMLRDSESLICAFSSSRSK